MNIKQKILSVAAFASMSAVISCGSWFDYGADEFDDVTKAAKGFENLSDDEVQAIVDRMAADRIAPVSTALARQALSAIAAVFSPQAATPKNLLLQDAKTNVNPCVVDENGQPNTKLLSCQPDQARFYIQEGKKLLTNMQATMGDINKVLLFILGDKTDAITCGSVMKDMSPRETLRAMLPEKWRSATIDLLVPAAAPANGDTCLASLPKDKQKYHLLMKRDGEAGAKLNVAYLAINPGTSMSGFEDVVPPEHKGDDRITVFFAINGKEGKIPGATDETLGNVYISYKDDANFFARVFMSNLPCQDAYVAAPDLLALDIMVAKGVWSFNLVTRNPRFGAASCSEPASDKSLLIFMPGGADTTNKFYSMVVAGLEGQKQIIVDYSGFDRICSVYPSKCTDGKLQPHLNEDPKDFGLAFCSENHGAYQWSKNLVENLCGSSASASAVLWRPTDPYIQKFAGFLLQQSSKAVPIAVPESL